jgi:hypothetical protein
MTLVVEVHFAERQTEGATEYRKIWAYSEQEYRHWLLLKQEELLQWEWDMEEE